MVELPSQQAYQLIQGRFPWIDQVCLETIPAEMIGNVDQTICLISEWLSEPLDYANATFKGWQIGVELQIFYRSDADVDSVDGEIALARLFVSDNWKVEQSKNHIQDPDTGQVTKTFYFSKNLRMKE